MVRRRAADRRRRRLHLQPGARRRPRGARPGRRTSTGSRRSPRPTTRPSCSPWRSPTRCCRCCRSRSSPSTSGRTSTRRRSRATPPSPTDGQPVVGSGPFRLVEGTAGGSTYRFEANPDYWQGAPHVDEVVFRVYKSEDPAVQALIKGEVDFVEDITALQVKSLQDKEGITAQTGDSPGFDEIAFNTGSIDVETGEPIGDPQPGRSTRAFRDALGYALDLDQIIEQGLPGRRRCPARRSSRRPTRPTTGSRRRTRLRPSTSRRPARCSTRPATPWVTTACGPCRTGHPIGDAAARRAHRLRRRLAADHGLLPGVARRARHRHRGGDLRVEQADRRHPRRRRSTLFEWGWYVEPDPGLDAQLHDLRPARQLVGLVVLQRGVRRPLRAAARRRSTTATRQDLVKQMQEILYRDAPYLVTAYCSIGEALRSDRFACFQPQPDPGGVWLIQYGSTTTSTCVRPTRPATATASRAPAARLRRRPESRTAAALTAASGVARRRRRGGCAAAVVGGDGAARRRAIGR